MGLDCEHLALRGLLLLGVLDARQDRPTGVCTHHVVAQQELVSQVFLREHLCVPDFLSLPDLIPELIVH